MDTYVLEAKKLTKKYDSFIAVDSVCFGLKKGEILGFLGPNGAGKTTTIQMLLGILQQTHGTVEYFGKNLETHREEILEKVNFSSTYVDLPWRLQVKEVLTYTSYLYTIADRAARVKRIIDIFRLQKLVNQEISSLSAGQKTRLNLAKAFLNFPAVLLLDEPTASLDPESAYYIRQFIMNQRNEFDVSVLFTSHNMAEVEEICDRVIFIHNGKIIAEDTPENLPKKIHRSRIELVLRDGMKRTVQLCTENKLRYTMNRRSIEIEIREGEIAQFLTVLSKKNIVYDQISIKKPNLQDFFFEVLKQHENT